MSHLPMSKRIPVVAILLALAIPSFAQQPATGQFSGHVTDLQGAVIPNASVFIREYYSADFSVKLVACTDAHGDFLLNLPQGGYDIVIASPGFASGMETVGVLPGKKSTAEWKLKVLGCDFPRVNCDNFGLGDPAKVPSMIDVTPQTLIN
jgi:hypothetical protein